MTRDLDLIKVDVDVIAMVARLRGAHVTDAKATKRRKAPRARTATRRGDRRSRAHRCNAGARKIAST